MNKILNKCFRWLARRAALRVLLLTIGVGVTAPALAALLDVTLTYPLIAYDNQGITTYDATTDQFVVYASPLAIQLTSSDAPVLIDPVPDLGEALLVNVTVDDTGVLTGGVPGDDLLVVGEVDLGATGFFSGVLLTGEVTGFGFRDSGGSTDSYDSTFTVTGGQLAFLYPSAVGVQVTSEQSDFTGDFTVNFGGEAKGTLGAVPIPAAVWLFGSGLICLIGIARRKKS